MSSPPASGARHERSKWASARSDGGTSGAEIDEPAGLGNTSAARADEAAENVTLGSVTRVSGADKIGNALARDLEEATTIPHTSATAARVKRNQVVRERRDMLSTARKPDLQTMSSSYVHGFGFLRQNGMNIKLQR